MRNDCRVSRETFAYLHSSRGISTPAHDDAASVNGPELPISP